MWLAQISNVVHPVTSMCCTLYMPALTAVGSPAAHDTCCMAVLCCANASSVVVIGEGGMASSQGLTVGRQSYLSTMYCR